jgi:hypothetical protein
MTLDDFVSRITKSLATYPFTDVRTTCADNSFKYNETFFNGTQWRNDMTLLYPKINPKPKSALSSLSLSLFALVAAISAYLLF